LLFGPSSACEVISRQANRPAARKKNYRLPLGIQSSRRRNVKPVPRQQDAGLGASHQTGWTALVAKLIQQQGEFGTIK
jgi:hypothetical protein